MDGAFVPTLKNLALLETSLMLYNDNEVAWIEKFIHRRCSLEDQMKKLVNSKVSKLDLPATLEETLVVLATGVGIQVRERNLAFKAMHEDLWKMLGHECPCLEGTLQNHYHWDSNAFADYDKIRRSLIKDTKIDVAYRFKLACEFNYINDMDLIWQQMPQVLKKLLVELDIPVILKFWTLMLLQRESMALSHVPLPRFFLSFLEIFEQEGFIFDGQEDDIQDWIAWFSSQGHLTSWINHNRRRHHVFI